MYLFIYYLLFILQRHIFSALSQIAKHSVDLAEMVVEAEIFPAVLACLKGKISCTILTSHTQRCLVVDWVDMVKYIIKFTIKLWLGVAQWHTVMIGVSKFESFLGSLCSVLGQDTLFWQSLILHPGIWIGFLVNCLGVTLWWTS